MRWSAGTLPTDFTFTGQRWEAALGLYDYRARFYDPVLGRFLQPDPIVPQPGSPQGLNRYAYVNNNPLCHTDPSGHCPWWIAIGVGALLGAGITYGFQVAANISQNGLNVQAFTEVNWAAVGAGAVAGAVGVATFGVGTAVLGTSLGGTVAAGALSSAIAGQAAQATENVLSGQAITEGLGEPADIARDALVGAVLAGVGYRVSQLIRPAVAEASGKGLGHTGPPDPNAIGRWGEQLVGERLPVEIRPVPMPGRTYDGRILPTGQPVEVKTTTRGVIYLNPRIRSQIAFDAAQEVKPLWVFVGGRPSRGLQVGLNKAGIPWQILEP